MWTMVDEQADHALTHNRPRKKEGTPETLRAQQALFWFWITAKERAPQERAII
jgi:hypothetical protein